MKKTLLLSFFFLVSSIIAAAQPRPAAPSNNDVLSAPDSYEVRYEGGVFGASAKDRGTIKIDDANTRIMFVRKEDGKEMFTIPYDALMVVYPDSKDSVPQSGKVISALPLPGAGLANLMNKETKYANLTFIDPDVDIQGTVSFRFESKANLLKFVNKLGTLAKMAQRGDAYYRPKKAVF